MGVALKNAMGAAVVTRQLALRQRRALGDFRMRKQLVLAFVLAVGGAIASAQSYPSRPITLVIPFGAGGPADAIGRIVAEGMREPFGQPVIVENVAGASGTIGVGRVAAAPADGYTSVLGNWATHVLNGAMFALRYDLRADFEPVALVSNDPLMIVARKSMPANDLKERMHQLRQDINEMTPEEVDELIRGLGDDAAEDWVFAARDAQLPPPDLSWCWLFLGGRGAGKSHSMTAAVHTAVRAGISRIHFIAPTTSDFHDVNIEGKSGIFATCGRDPRPRWVSSRRRLEWPNGAMCVFFSGEEPESLRGPQCELAVIDEIGRMRYQQAVFDNMMLGLRLGDRPRVLLATTPRTTPFMKKLVAMDDIRITTGSTYDNAAHLSADFLKKVRELYEGTRLGRQELQGAMILDSQNALFKDDWLIHNDVPEDIIEQVTVGVDPSGGNDEVGIVASALLNDGKVRGAR